MQEEDLEAEMVLVRKGNQRNKKCCTAEIPYLWNLWGGMAGCWERWGQAQNDCWGGWGQAQNGFHPSTHTHAPTTHSLTLPACCMHPAPTSSGCAHTVLLPSLPATIAPIRWWWCPQQQMSTTDTFDSSYEPAGIMLETPEVHHQNNTNACRRVFQLFHWLACVTFKGYPENLRTRGTAHKNMRRSAKQRRCQFWQRERIWTFALAVCLWRGTRETRQASSAHEAVLLYQ